MPIPRVPQDPTTTFIAPGDYTVAQVQSDLIDIILRNPDNLNPIRGTKCVYLQNGERCLIGTWLHERGHDYDSEWDSPGAAADNIAFRLGYPTDVQSVLYHWQQKVDRVPGQSLFSVPMPQPWRSLLELTDVPTTGRN